MFMLNIVKSLLNCISFIFVVEVLGERLNSIYELLFTRAFFCNPYCSYVRILFFNFSKWFNKLLAMMFNGFTENAY